MAGNELKNIVEKITRDVKTQEEKAKRIFHFPG